MNAVLCSSTLVASMNHKIFSLDISAKNKHAASSRLAFCLINKKSASVSASMLINYGNTHTHTRTQLLHYTVPMYPSNTLWLSNSPAVCLLVLYSLLCSLVPILAWTSPWHGPCWPSSIDRAQQQQWGFFETVRHFERILELLHGSLVISRFCMCVFI